MNIKVNGHVEVVLRDLDGNVIQKESGNNTVVQMSNNILMDNILPVLGNVSSATAVANRAEGSNMTDNTTFGSGANYIGPAGAMFTKANATQNCIAYIAVGDNVGTDSAGNAHVIGNQNSDVSNPNQQTNMVDGSFDPTSTSPYYCRLIDSVTFPAYNQIRFTTQFQTTEGNLSDGIAEIGIFTAGNNCDSDGFHNDTTPQSTTNMRLFARKVLGNTITKTDDGTLDITYTLTFSA